MVVRGRKIKAVTNEAVTAAFALTSSHFSETSSSQDNSESFIHTSSLSDTCFLDRQKQWQKKRRVSKGVDVVFSGARPGQKFQRSYAVQPLRDTAARSIFLYAL